MVNLADHMPWVRRLAKRFHPNDRDDVTQVGLMKLVECAKRFDAIRGVKLRTFAQTRVLGAMIDYLRAPYRTGRRVPLNTLAPIDAAEHVPGPDSDEPRDAVRQFRVLHGKVRKVEAATCEWCSRNYWRRIDRPNRWCSTSCANRARLQREVRCSVCMHAFARRHRRNTRCAECRAARRMPARSA